MAAITGIPSAAITVALDIPTIMNSGKAAAVWTAQPMPGARNNASCRGATRIESGNPTLV
jgi:hypothetical protein